MKLAVIISGSDYHNFVGINKIAVTRAELLKKNYDYNVDFFYLECKYEKLCLRNFFSKELIHYTTIVNNRQIHILQKKQFISDNIIVSKFLRLYYKFTKKKISDWEWQESLGKFIKNYDLITAHFNDAALIAYGAKKRYGIPYCVTWHGSDIHTIPFNDSAAKVKTIEAIENADHNFFVSKALLAKSNELTPNGIKGVIYNSVDDRFIKFKDELRVSLRNKFNVTDCKVVSFIGNLIDVKNASLLPEIFKKIQDEFHNRITFWIIGEGNLHNKIDEKLKRFNLNAKMWGTVEPNEIPFLLNCTDVLILPSKNEGLPLVTIEALRCGANVVGSRVGGIPEVIGDDYSITLNEDFVDNFSGKVIDLLYKSETQHIPSFMTLESIVAAENSIYRNIKNS